MEPKEIKANKQASTFQEGGRTQVRALRPLTFSSQHTFGVRAGSFQELQPQVPNHLAKKQAR